MWQYVDVKLTSILVICDEKNTRPSPSLSFDCQYEPMDDVFQLFNAAL